MHLPTHLVLSWLVGHRLADRRDRVLVAWAGVIPDLDSASILGGLDTYGLWHHVLTHGLLAAIATTFGCMKLAIDKKRTAICAAIAFHLHLVCDLLGSGREWSISYLYPFTKYEIFTPYGWSLGSWQNIVITAIAFAYTGYVGVKYGRTFAEAWLPERADAAIVKTLRARFAPAALVVMLALPNASEAQQLVKPFGEVSDAEIYAGQIVAGGAAYYLSTGAAFIATDAVGLLDITLCISSGSAKCPERHEGRKVILGASLVFASGVFASTAAMYALEETSGKEPAFWWPIVAGLGASGASMGVTYLLYESSGTDAITPGLIACFVTTIAAEMIVMRLLRPD